MQYPRTVREAIRAFLSRTTENERDVIRSLTKEELVNVHHILGMRIRNEFGLWDDNYELLISSGMAHPDDASMVIIEAVWEVVHSNK